MRLYFAYGSNMSVQQMKRRCPAARPLGIAHLDGWRFIINMRGTASIVPHPGGRVEGVLWRCTSECVATLDVFEGVGKKRYRKLHVPVAGRTDGRPVLTYAGMARGEGRPIRAYLEGTILPAATHWGLSDAYRSELARWLEPNTLGPLKPHPRRRGWRP
ncbi:MAG: gamma-glutamylcyclotransferase [Rhodobiaceae bacterium]|nr:gamma-glutamylcyclotransferase [Rhodobiaceae bacterium]